MHNNCSIKKHFIIIIVCCPWRWWLWRKAQTRTGLFFILSAVDIKHSPWAEMLLLILQQQFPMTISDNRGPRHQMQQCNLSPRQQTSISSTGVRSRLLPSWLLIGITTRFTGCWLAGSLNEWRNDDTNCKAPRERERVADWPSPGGIVLHSLSGTCG